MWNTTLTGISRILQDHRSSIRPPSGSSSERRDRKLFHSGPAKFPNKKLFSVNVCATITPLQWRILCTLRELGFMALVFCMSSDTQWWCALPTGPAL